MEDRSRSRPTHEPSSASRPPRSPGNPSSGTRLPDPSDSESPLLAPSVVARFLAKIDFAGPDDCWEWTGSRHPRFPHGRLVVGGRAGKVEYAHRLAWLYWVGPIPDGLLVRHTCDNPPCVNPAHLLLGTQADNALDMVKRRRHGRQKMTLAQIDDIASRPRGRGTGGALAAEFGVHPQTITEIRSGRYRRTR
jgi:hypothetical protein